MTIQQEWWVQLYLLVTSHIPNVDVHVPASETQILTMACVTAGFHSGVNEIFTLLGCYAV